MPVEVTQGTGKMACFVCDTPGRFRVSFGDVAIPMCENHKDTFTDQCDAMAWALGKFLTYGWKLSDIWLEGAVNPEVYATVFHQSFDDALHRLNDLLAPTQSLNLCCDAPARKEDLSGVTIGTAGIMVKTGQEWERVDAPAGQVARLRIYDAFMGTDDCTYLDVGYEPVVERTVIPAWALGGRLLTGHWRLVVRP